MALRVTLIQGGGIGFDQSPAVQRILDAAGVAIEWDEHLGGLASMERGGPPLPEALLQSVRANGLALKTKLLSPPSPASSGAAGKDDGVNYNVQLRRALGLFASVRPLRNLQGLPARSRGVDMLVIRELTEDLYAAIEHEIIPGVVQSIKVVTDNACRRFFRFALQWTRAARRKTVHCVHKANILKLADGLFLKAFRETAQEFPELQTREMIVDNCCMQLVLKPQQFDVLVMGNLYGDLVSDLGAGVVGGISATAGINVGEGGAAPDGLLRVYEAFHGGSREAIGVNRANPLPLLLPALDLLRSVGQAEAAGRILNAVENTLMEGKASTADLGGDSSTSQMADAILSRM